LNKKDKAELFDEGAFGNGVAQLGNTSLKTRRSMRYRTKNLPSASPKLTIDQEKN